LDRLDLEMVPDHAKGLFNIADSNSLYSTAMGKKFLLFNYCGQRTRWTGSISKWFKTAATASSASFRAKFAAAVVSVSV
jgi:hypothetical protein